MDKYRKQHNWAIIWWKVLGRVGDILHKQSIQNIQRKNKPRDL